MILSSPHVRRCVTRKGWTRLAAALFVQLFLAMDGRAESPSYEELVARAREAMRNGRSEEAAILASEAVRAKARGHEAAALLGAACYQLGRKEDAVVALRHAVACAPRASWPEYYWLLAAADPQDAAKRAEEAAARGRVAALDGLNFKSAEAYWLAWLYNQRDDRSAILAAVGYEVTGSLPEAATLLRAVSFRRGDLPEPMKAFATRLRPRIDAALASRKSDAGEHLRRRELEKALEAARAAVQLGPEDGSACLLLARAQAASKQPAESLQALLAAIGTGRVTAREIAGSPELIEEIPPEVLRSLALDVFGKDGLEQIEGAYRQRDAAALRAKQAEEDRRRAAAAEEREALRRRAASAAGTELRGRWEKARGLLRSRSWFVTFESEDGEERYGPFALDDVGSLQFPARSASYVAERTRMETRTGRDKSGKWSTAGWITASVPVEPDENTRGTGQVEFEIEVEYERVTKRLFGTRRETFDWTFRAPIGLDALLTLLATEKPEILGRSRGYLARLHSEP